jgi:hypothetical protein
MTAPRAAIAGFVAGALAVLVFHQGALLALRLAGLVPAPPWRLAPVPPFGVPAVLSAAFWGGIWGIALAPRFGRGAGRRLGAPAPGAPSGRRERRGPAQKRRPRSRPAHKMPSSQSSLRNW